MKRFVIAIFALVAIASVMQRKDETTGAATASTESYRLVHAIGNDETVVARGLSKSECQRRKRDNIAVAEALGIHSERLGVGSITCLPESFFLD